MRRVLQVHDEPESPVFKVYDEPHWSGVFKVDDNRNRQMRGVFKIYDEPES